MSRLDAAVGIVAALPDELHAIVGRATVRAVGARLYRGHWLGRRVAIAYTGGGVDRAAAGLRALVASEPLVGVIGIGVAGGLMSGLSVGDVVLSARVYDAHGPVAPPDSAWLGRAVVRTPRAQLGAIVTVERLVTTAVMKAELRRSTKVDAAVVDMESAAWARVAAQSGVPYVVARSVLDRAEDDLPDVLTSVAELDPDAGRRRALALALRRPRALLQLAGVGLRMRACRRRLAEAAEHLLDTCH
jgi:nucleoside phosphorylase